MKPRRKHYEKKLGDALRAQSDFLLTRLKQEWDEIQLGAKREELVRRAKSAAGIMGKSLLVLLAVAGAVTVAAVAPNVFAAVGRATGRRGFFAKKEFQQATKYLKRRKFIAREEDTPDGFRLVLTPRGADVVFGRAFKDLKIKHSKKWDRTWRIVIFDIPNKHKWERDAFRQRLNALGFRQLQESVFVLPYECEEEIEFLVSLFNLAPYFRFVRTKEISYDDDLREFFSV